MERYISLIRHGCTAGNRRGQYIGRTDESLDEQGIRELGNSSFPFAGEVVISPMKRCAETAAILFPGARLRVAENLRECDFGRYEGKTYKELRDDPVYQTFLKTGQIEQFPAGEVVAEFKARCCLAFAELISGGSGEEELFIIAHGGTIMAIMEAFARPARSYYDWQVSNGCGWRVKTDPDLWQRREAGKPYIEVIQKLERI